VLGYLGSMGGVITRDSPVPPWRQIFTIIKDKIEAGELPSGSRLPSIRGISQDYGVAMTTAQKVIEALRDEGLVTTSPMGTFVS
jgi:GntR family transcriptional regulator